MKIKMIMILSVLIVISCQTPKTKIQPAYSPIPIEKEMPLYPDILKKAGVAGSVELSVLIDEKGTVTDVKIIKSIPIVDSVSIAAAKKWRFKPGTIPDKKGNQVPFKFWFPISFNWSVK